MATWVDTLYPGGSRQLFAGDEFPFKRAPSILVLHSTETDGYPGYTYNKAPHLTVNYRQRTWRQHRPLNKPSWSLEAGSISTNSAGAIQVEIVGRAATLKDIGAADLAWLGGLLRMLCQQAGIPIQSSVTFGGPETYGVNGPKRLSAARWNGYVGILGHQHVPTNSHWDPGALDIQQWLLAIRGGAVQPPALEGDSDMATLVSISGPDGKRAVYNETIGWVNATAPGVLEYYVAIAGALKFRIETTTVDANGWVMAQAFKIPAPAAADVDEEALAKALAPLLGKVTGGPTVAEITAAVKGVLNEAQF